MPLSVAFVSPKGGNTALTYLGTPGNFMCCQLITVSIYTKHAEIILNTVFSALLLPTSGPGDMLFVQQGGVANWNVTIFHSTNWTDSVY